MFYDLCAGKSRLYLNTVSSISGKSDMGIECPFCIFSKELANFFRTGEFLGSLFLRRGKNKTFSFELFSAEISSDNVLVN